MKTFVSILLCLILVLLVPSLPRSAPLSPVIRQETDWIASLQREDGAILTFSDRTIGKKISPYFANLAAAGLAQDPQKLERVQKYLDWYFKHLNKPDRFGAYGTIYDYVVDEKGQEISTQNYDSADSYAATFLSLLQTYVEQGGDPQVLLAHREDIEAVAHVIVSLLDRDSIAFSKTYDHTKFLMDNCEVYQGLKDFAKICENVFHDQAEADTYYALAEKVRTSVLAGFSNNGDFYISVDGKGKNPGNWGLWYPDSIAQFYPILYGLIPADSDQARYLYYKFNVYHPRWPELHADGSDYPWVMVGYVAAMMHDWIKVERFMQEISSQYPGHYRPYPWFSSESYWLIQLERMRAQMNHENGKL